jgi:hypothetical protein
MGLVYWWVERQTDVPVDMGLFFILISLITLPHAFLVDRVYR